MVKKEKDVFLINTNDLSYVFHIDKTGLVIHDYFGKKIDLMDFDIKPLSLKHDFAKGTSVIYDEKIDDQLSMDHVLLEFSFPHKGDYRSTPILLKSDKSGYTFDFSYKKYEIKNSPLDNEELPAPHDHDEELVIYLEDSVKNRAVVDVNPSYKDIEYITNYKAEQHNYKVWPIAKIGFSYRYNL